MIISVDPAFSYPNVLCNVVAILNPYSNYLVN